MTAPTTAAGLIDELTALGVELWSEDGQIRFRAPQGVLTEERRAALRHHKERVVALLDAEDAARTVTADPAAAHEPFPLTDVQSAYLLGRRDPFGLGGVACHGYLEIHYPSLDAAALEDAWNALIARHAMLRAVVHEDGYQRTLAEVPRCRIAVTDLRDDPAGRERHLESVRADLGHRTYDTTRWPLFELRVTRLPDGDVLHFSLDSLVADWASAAVLLDELDTLLASPDPTDTSSLPRAAISFRDYVLAERALKDTARHRRDRDYWRSRLASLPPAPDLPLVSAPDGGAPRFARLSHRLPAPAWERLRGQAAARGLTPTTAVLAAYVSVLERWSRRTSFTVNLTLLNRMPLHPDVDRLVGDFTSVTLLAVEAQPGAAPAERAKRLGERLFTDLDHRLYSGVEVIRDLTRARGREAALMPYVFTSSLGLGPGSSERSGRRLGVGITQTPQVFLDCQVGDGSGDLEVNWDIRQGVLPDGVAEDMLAAFGTLLDVLADDPDAWDRPNLVALPAWQERERRAVNDTAGPLPEGLLHEGFFARAARTPDAPALLGAFGTVTYGELARRAGAVADALRAAGRTGGDRIAVVMDKGPEQAAAVLGVLLAGCVYVPVDTTQPALRRARLLTSAGVRQVLTQSWVEDGEGRPEGVARVDVDRLIPGPSIPVPAAGDPGAPAYVIYTSGSTGDPKGVVTSHRAALNTVDDVNERFGVTGTDRVLQLAQLGFDLSVYDVFGALATGAALVLPDPARGADPSHWAELIARHGVTLWNSVPAQLHMLADYLTTEPAELDSLRLALLSGDWIPVTLPGRLRKLLPGLSLMSLGGATEAAIWSIHHPVTEADDGRTSIPYGVPLRNQGFRVLDEDGRDCPVWVPGELCITGEGLALGYLDDPELTARRFPGHPHDGQRLYRTGDVGRYLPGGEIEFLGREDNQVKIRGHRIELGEVEAALLAQPAVGAAAAVVSDDDGDRMLLGFVEPAPRTAPDETARDARLRTAAQRHADRLLPDAGPERTAAHHRALHRAALLTMLHALRRRGALTGAGAAASAVARSADEVLDAARVAPRHRWLVRHWLTALAEAGLLERDEAGRYRAGEAVDDPDTAWAEAARGIADGLCTADYLAYHRAHTDRLDDLLDDRLNPFDLLFPEGDDAPARAVYRDDALARHLNAAVAAVVHRRAAEHDGPGPLRVLELGAGTGATTESVLPLLDGFDVDYLFTDVSPSFLPRARAAFQGQGLRYGVVDIDRDPLPQGLPPNSADLVLCAGVLNSARDSARAVRTAVELLAPGGLLVVTEPVGAHPHILLTQGFMMEPADGDREAGACPLLDEDGWRALFDRAGADPVLTLPGAGHALDSAGHRLFVLRAKADRTPLRSQELAAFVAERLPAAMVPGHLQVVDALPMTANGKIDRRALAARRPGELAGAEAAVADGDAGLEERLCALWATALGITALAPEDNFYDHGADSLILARVAGRLREEVPEAAEFTYDALLRQMLNEPTVRALARALRTTAAPAAADAGARDTSGNALLVPFGGAPHPDGTVRVMFHAALGTLDYFQHLGRALAAQDLGPVLGVAVADAELYTATPPERLVATVADRYAQRLADEGHTRFQLIGYCLGGLLATEVARRLTERGLRVDDLTLVDSIPMFLDTDEELAYESIFVPNLGLDPVPAVFGPDVADQDVYRAVELLTERGGGRVPAGALAALDETDGADEGLAAVAAAARRAAARPQEERLAAYARAAEDNAQVPVDAELVPALFRTCRHSMKAAHLQLEPYAGDMTFLRAAEQQSFGVTGGVGHLAEPFWAETCLGRFTVTDVPGNHFSVIEPPHVHTVAEHLAAPLRDAKGDTPR
ncbi:amino acid adenylation domain-containing protein [Streptomyces sp. ISL-12]|uniref:non-ribosomal peptide synthetase n=1 Tax=Streptomyces sp. ISL-12 TaxID=2819177 RepID=UPI001BE83163|nr:non-ribosomal peptide synthetase [Streptomyces sp. ISL-12]MBT2413612.1 amino acid adenylation domain-containing protein [Streptomyces sp. ISL-12]